MHVTIALPWWWHTIQEGNNQLTKSMAQRFKQTLLLKFHYPFQIELERIILLGGKVLVALWRCVGNRTTEDGRVIYDRHGKNLDPMHRLREEIIRCFTTESPDERRQPLTYQHRKMNSGDKNTTPALDPQAQHTIKQRTPGMGSQSSADGFIHTTLCRLPLECLSSRDVELDAVHRLCREASATLNGHRMVVEKYRFLETMGEGGESNPCYRPIYDEIIQAPLKHTVGIDGSVEEKRIHSTPHQVDGNLTYGRASLATDRNFISESADEDTENTMKKTATLSDLFEPPTDIDKTVKTENISE